MDKKAVIDTVAEFRKSIERKGVKISRIVLFGSYATGANRRGSDIDLVVISEDFAGKTYWERIDIISDAVYEVFQPIEATALTDEEWRSGDYFVCEYARNGEIIYDAQKAA